MKERAYLILGLNPEPWTAPDAAVGRAKGGKLYVQMHKSMTLAAFQEALHDELLEMDTELLDLIPVYLKIFVWRQLAAYEAESGKQVRRHGADATNMQKAIEDACQGILFKNDSQVSHVDTVVVAQGPDVEPAIIIEVGPTASFGLSPEKVIAMRYARGRIPVIRQPEVEVAVQQPTQKIEEIF